MEFNLLAIILPYYKLTFFEETLKSLSNQTDKRFKVYIGDDASPENPENLLDKYKDKIDFIYHRFEGNLGGTSLTQQWERCIALSNNEEWLMILGDDDVLGKSVVEQFYKNLIEIKEKNISVIRFATFKIDESGKLISDKYRHPIIENSSDFLFRKTRSSLSEYVFRKDEVLSIGFRNLPLAWFSDVLAVLEFSHFKEIFTINEASVFVRISKINISGLIGYEKQKSKANFMFHNYLIVDKKEYFNSSQILKLLNKISKLYLNDKKNFLLFLRISKLYLQKGLVTEYFLFLNYIFKLLYKRTKCA